MHTNKPFNLENKTILITGASSGIGRDTAIALSDLGAKLIITGRDINRVAATFSLLKGEDHQQIIADLSDELQINNLVDSISTVNGIVHSAGVTNHIPAKFIRSQDIASIFKINFEAPVLLTSRILKQKKLAKKSSLVFLSSVSTAYPFFGGSLYTSSKTALEGYSRTLAIELAPQEIRSNCISPSLVNTPLVAEAQKVISLEVIEKSIQRTPLGLGTTADVANAIAFYLSDASKWITGTNLILGGG